MTKEPKEIKGINRRNFLKGAAIGVGSVVMAGCAPKSVTTPVPATAAPAETSSESSLPENARPIPAAAAPANWDYETDVVVVGGGGAGMAAAITAVEKGAKVILLEKNSFCGGDSSCAMAFAVINSKAQERLGIPPSSIKEIIEGAGWGNFYTPDQTCGGEPGMARMVLERQGEVADWLESIGVIYESSAIFNVMPAGSVLMPVDPEAPDEGWYRLFPHNGAGITRVLAKHAGEVGVNIMLQTPAQALVVDSGKVIGVKATTQDGKDIFIKAKVTVLASGGYAANRDMINAYVPYRRTETQRAWCLPSQTGDGIRMAQGIGATIYGMDEIILWDGPVTQAKDGMDLNYNAASQLARQKTLTVNKKGERFFNEAGGTGIGYDYQAAQKMKQVDHTTFPIYDSTLVKAEDIIKNFIPTFCEYPIPGFDEQFEKYLADGTIIKADSIEELASKIGVDPQALKKTVDHYNEMCEKGSDDDFFKLAMYLHPIKTPPFYSVVEVAGACYQTFGGLLFNNQLQVLDEKQNPIPGLYAAGEVVSCFGSLSGSTTTGRMAGENAAAEAQA